MKHFIKESQLRINLAKTEFCERLKYDFGWGNGYVILEKNHPYFGKEYDEIPVDVHGGLTYGREITEKMIELWDELSEEDLGKWIVGFDTGHFEDKMFRWP